MTIENISERRMTFDRLKTVLETAIQAHGKANTRRATTRVLARDNSQQPYGLWTTRETGLSDLKLNSTGLEHTTHIVNIYTLYFFVLTTLANYRTRERRRDTYGISKKLGFTMTVENIPGNRGNRVAGRLSAVCATRMS